MFHIKFLTLESKNIDDMKSKLEKTNIIYDGYVMLMNKEKIILHDFNKIRNDSNLKNKGDIIISDYKFNYSYDLNNFITKEFSEIPNKLRAFSVIYDFENEDFLINNNLVEKKEFIKISMKEILNQD